MQAHKSYRRGDIVPAARSFPQADLIYRQMSSFVDVLSGSLPATAVPASSKHSLAMPAVKTDSATHQKRAPVMNDVISLFAQALGEKYPGPTQQRPGPLGREQ